MPGSIRSRHENKGAGEVAVRGGGVDRMGICRAKSKRQLITRDRACPSPHYGETIWPVFAFFVED